MTWEEWKRLKGVERLEDEEPRTVEVSTEQEVSEPERAPERELVHA